MDELTNKDFIEFIEHYKEKTYVDRDNDYKVHKCYDTITELSRSDTRKADALIKNKQEMYALDWIVKSSKKLEKNTPKSTDALFVREDEKGNLNLHLIEFKFIGNKSHTDKINKLWNDIKKMNRYGNEYFDEFFVNDFNLIRNTFKDPVEVSLQLKPYEVILITLPELYNEYCDEKKIPKKDIKRYLSKIKKYYWAFIGNFSKNEYNVNAKAKKYNRYNKRLEKTVFIKARVKPRQRFNMTLKNEILRSFDGNFY